MEHMAKTPCELCLGIIQWMTSYRGPNGLLRQKLEWHQDIECLQVSARSCPLCASFWDLSLAKTHSSSMTRLGGKMPSKPGKLVTEVTHVFKTKEVSWGVINTEMNVEELQRVYNCTNMVGISPQSGHKGHAHPSFWVCGKADREKTLREDRIGTLREWLQECEANHRACLPVAERYPTRILDVNPDDPIRLVSRDQIHRDKGPIRYATLSHSWGNHVQIQTTTDTKPEFEACISEELLTRTFRDAVAITRSLGIRYLWIDSLCIVQNDPEDWQTEALEMKDIYAGSAINIAASEATDGRGGCFGEDVENIDVSFMSSRDTIDKNSTPTTKSPRVFIYQDKDGQSTLIRFQTRTPRQLQSWAHLSTRGWVLQEELLSHRIVHCMKAELHWQCKCAYKTQAGQEFDPLEMISDQQDLNVAPAVRKERMWYEWMEGYSARNFTIPSDRVAALAGVSRHYQQLTGFSPMLGAWKVTGLLWVRLGSWKGLGGPNMPSWTWLSCNAPVGFDFWGGFRMHGNFTLRDRVTLGDGKITWTGLAGVSTVKSASLVISGYTQELRLRVAEGANYNPPYLNIEGEELDLSKPIPWPCAGQFDDETIPRQEFETYTCLLMRSCSSGSAEKGNETFLILEQATSVAEGLSQDLLTFRRVGIASIFGGGDIFASSERKTIVLR